LIGPNEQFPHAGQSLFSEAWTVRLSATERDRANTIIRYYNVIQQLHFDVIGCKTSVTPSVIRIPFHP